MNTMAFKVQKSGGSDGHHGRDQEKDCRADNKHHLTDYEEKALSLMNFCDSDDGKDGRDDGEHHCCDVDVTM